MNCDDLGRFVVALSVLIPSSASEVRGEPEPHEVFRATSPITIDGRLDEPAWESAFSLTLDYEFEPGDNIAPPVATRFFITYDEDRLYVAFRAEDPEPEKIRARLADRDTIDSDDLVGVIIDTFNDARRAYEFLVNPLGVQMDLTRDDVNDQLDTSWDAIWHSAGRITPEGFVTEMAVPFSSFTFPKSEGSQTWGFEALRIYPRGVLHRIGNQRRDRDVDCYLCQLSKVEGFEGVSPGRNLEVTPTLTAGRSERLEGFPDGEFTSDGEDVDPGVTASWGITPNLVLQATVNPDFSQVEADSAELDINRQFAIFFPERRPFFLEDADLFRTPFQAVFTRNVADPSWGLKLTGKQDKHALGVFVAEDELTNLIFPGSQGSAAGSFPFRTTDAVVRYRRDVGKSSTVGALVTSRSGGIGGGNTADEYTNVVTGVDALLRFGGDSDSVRFQLLASRTEYPLEVARQFAQPASAFDDHALHLTYVHQDEKWRWWGVYEDVGEDFRADMGFMPQVGFKNARGGLERSWWGEEGDRYRRVRVGLTAARRDDASGQTLEKEYRPTFIYEGPWHSYVEPFVAFRKRFFNGVWFDEFSYSSWAELQPSGRLWLGLWLRGGDDIDFVNTRPAKAGVIEPTVRLDVNRRVRLRFSHRLHRLDVDGGRLFEAGLTQARVVYQLNLRTFVRVILQYTKVKRDLSLFNDPGAFEAKTERLFSQLLFSYKVNPRTVVFLGYSDNYRGDATVSLTQENRALFLKIGYAWVL